MTPKAADDFPLPCPVLRRTTDSARATAAEGTPRLPAWRAVAPENTLDAFRRALEVGATGLESDARLAADGEVVLVHGPTIRTGLRRVKVRSLPAGRLAELGVPRLADLYAELGCDFELSLDLKEPDAAGPILSVARAAGALDRLWLCARDVSDLEAVRRADPDVRLVHS